MHKLIYEYEAPGIDGHTILARLELHRVGLSGIQRPHSSDITVVAADALVRGHALPLGERGDEIAVRPSVAVTIPIRHTS